MVIRLEQMIFEDFGKYVFDEPRLDIPAWDKETMSPKEKNALELLQRFFQERSQETKQRLSAVMPELLRLRDRYPEELMVKDFAFLYRVTSWTSREEAVNMLATPAEVNLNDRVIVQKQAVRLKPKPSDFGVSVWTIAANLESALVDNYGLKSGFVTVFRAPVAGNPFVGNPGKLAVALGISDLQIEMESLAYGAVNCDAVSFSYDDTHTLPSFKSAMLQLAS
jgi:hypothetical protein